MNLFDLIAKFKKCLTGDAIYTAENEKMQVFMREADCQRSFVHERPEPTTNPPDLPIIEIIPGNSIKVEQNRDYKV